MWNVIYKIVHLALLTLIFGAMIALINTVNDKGINMKFYQRISTETVSLDIEAKSGTTINVSSPISMPKE